MSACQNFEAMIERLAANDLPPQELSSLLAHTQGCESCGRLLALHEQLTEAGARVPEPDEDELDFRQAQVLKRVGNSGDSPLFLRKLQSSKLWKKKGTVPLPLAAGLLLAFVTGLLAGRVLPGRAGAASSSSRLIDTLHVEAASNHALPEVEDSPFTYSNVAYHRMPGDRVALDFDVTTHLAVTESERSPLVREVLAQSLLNPSSVGERLKAISLAAESLEPKLEQAVLFALRHDDNVAVRLAALTVLVGHMDDEDVQSALMTALHDDPSVQVRLAALESLASHRVDHGRIRDAIREQPRTGNEALMVRLTELEKTPGWR